MKRFFSSLCIAMTLFASVSCEKESIITPVDSDSSLIWHIADVEFLDSIVEYSGSALSYIEKWDYDEFGRKKAYYKNSKSEKKSTRFEWTYSEGGRNISILESEDTGNGWDEKYKWVVTVVALNDSCSDFYKMEGGSWILETKSEHICDSYGRTLMESGYYPASNIGTKNEYTYDENGYCILHKSYSRLNGEWILSGEKDCSFDERGNCIYVKQLRFNPENGAVIGDSLMERSFDGQNRENSYSLLRWDQSESAWYGIQKYEQTYDERGNVIENIIYAWDSPAGKWIPKERSSRLYDVEGRLTLDANYTWLDGIWVGLGLKYEKGYDSNGNLVLDASYAWDVSDTCWSLRNRVTEVFDSEGNVTHSITEDGFSVEELSWVDGHKVRDSRRYNIVTGELSSANRRIEYVDENGRDTLILSLHWLREEWQESEKAVYTYDARGNETSSYSYKMQDGEWVLMNGYKYEVTVEGNVETKQKYVWDLYYKTWNETSVRDVVTYNESGKIRSILTQEKVWDNATDTHWNDDKRIEYSYDSFGNNTGFVVSYMDDRWIYGEKQEYAFDAAGNKVLEAHYMYDNTNEVWIGLSKWTAEFDGYGNQTLLMNYKWVDRNEWEPSLKTISLFDEEGRQLDRATFVMKDIDGVWSWQGDSRTVFMYDPETKTTREFNLTFNYATQSWKGDRTDVETDEKGKIVRETVYEWADEQWVRKSDKTFDSKGNPVSVSYSRKVSDGVASIEENYTYDAKNRLVLMVRKYNGEELYRKATYYSVHKGIKVIDDMKF